MPGQFSIAEHYRQQADQYVAMAKAATSNKMRAHHYAAAERYLRLAEEAANSIGVLTSRLQKLVQLSRSTSHG
jgi:hypothetical protein